MLSLNERLLWSIQADSIAKILYVASALLGILFVTMSIRVKSGDTNSKSALESSISPTFSFRSPTRVLQSIIGIAWLVITMTIVVLYIF